MPQIQQVNLGRFQYGILSRYQVYGTLGKRDIGFQAAAFDGAMEVTPVKTDGELHPVEAVFQGVDGFPG